jgi:TPP-dependent pyruvate/acetoin dehydrogenase alpha subunit
MPSMSSLYEQMFLIRAFEERMLELFQDGKLFGTTHTYSGQEAVAVAVMANLATDDVVFSSHRCHGHYLARFDDPEGLLAELTGKSGGVCGGRGGSQHLCHDSFFSNGIQGGYMPIATGMALAEKRSGGRGIVVAFIGDGTLGEGAVYESFNLASLLEVPLLVVLEDNGYAQTTPVHLNLAGSMRQRAEAFGIETGESDGNDVEQLLPVFQEAVERVRRGGRPWVQLVHTYRLGPHSKGDDHRPLDEIEAWRAKDPLRIARARLSKEAGRRIETAVLDRLTQCEARVKEMPPARLVEE